WPAREWARNYGNVVASAVLSPGRPLTVVDLTEIQDIPIDRASCRHTPLLGNAPVPMLLPIFEMPVALQVSRSRDSLRKILSHLERAGAQQSQSELPLGAQGPPAQSRLL